jgi:NADH dehydrogenase/NADH:ubiquinone oxidoreductase subunit G
MSKAGSKLDIINEISLTIAKAHIQIIKLKEHIDELKTSSSAAMGENDKAIDCVGQAIAKAKDQDAIINLLLNKNNEMTTLLLDIVNSYNAKDINELERHINKAAVYTTSIIT